MQPIPGDLLRAVVEDLGPLLAGQAVQGLLDRPPVHLALASHGLAEEEGGAAFVGRLPRQVEVQDDSVPQVRAGRDPRHVLPPEEKLVEPAGHPEEVRLLQRKRTGRIQLVELRGDARQQREEGRDAHAGSDGNQHLGQQRPLDGSGVRPVDDDLRQRIPDARPDVLARPGERLRPVADPGDDEVQRGLAAPGADREGVPLEGRVLRHAEEGVHASVVPALDPRARELQLEQGPVWAAVPPRPDQHALQPRP
mmetsp:Transcript_74553/g.230404  ORF Transcript_74553/g.230404 Transcript_74553/m.230404 type:complete len:252 (-) Transcript_74553:324-1079(-)